MESLPKPGDRVRVPFGTHLLDGEVRRVSTTGTEPIPSTYALADVEMATAA